MKLKSKVVVFAILASVVVAGSAYAGITVPLPPPS